MFKTGADGQPRRWLDDPFTLANQAAYQSWRDAKLADYPTTIDELMTEVRDASTPSPAERSRILALCAKTNMALFHDRKGRLVDRAALRRFAAAFGLKRLSPHLLADPDGIASITPTSRRKIKGEYIPYTRRALNWHTDGYYAVAGGGGDGGRGDGGGGRGDGDDAAIRGFLLYCVRAANDDNGEGGESALIDPEIVYIRLREQNPGHIAAFARPDAMTVPANVQDGVEIRAEAPGPVFSTNAASGRLIMRYTARSVSIVWPDDAGMNDARAALDDILASESAFCYGLKAGDGLLCNNVLHRRSAFDDPNRLLYRGRFLDYISETE